MASNSSIQQRVSQLEQEMAALKKHMKPSTINANPWIDELFGVFRDDATFKDAAKLGREYSKSLDNKQKKRRASRNGHS